MIKIAHLYYDLMNLYGESGNIKALKKGFEQQGLKTSIEFLTIGDKINFENYDLFYIGSGTNNNMLLVLKDLLNYKTNIEKAIKENKFFLVTGNAIRIFGKEIIDKSNKKIIGTNTFEYSSKETDKRLVGDVIANCDFINKPILGFQNQDSQLINISNPLFYLDNGFGTIDDNKIEGLHINNFYATYVIGPILVRNPELLKYMIKNIIKQKNSNFKFNTFNLKLETKSYEEFIKQHYSKTNV